MSDKVVREPWCGACLVGVLVPEKRGLRLCESRADARFSRHQLPGREEVHRMARSTKPAESGCPVRRRKLLPVLNWRRSRKDVNRELHAENGNTSSSVAPSYARNVRPRVDPANDDDMDLSLVPTIVVPPTMPRAADLSLEPNAQQGPVSADDRGTGAL